MNAARCALLASVAVAQELKPPPAVASDRVLTSRRGAVVCVERRAAEIGARVLAEGGNAVDAAIALAFALAVTHPAAGNVGGGGFMLVHHLGEGPGDGRSVAIDYRETAPAAAAPSLFLDGRGQIDPLRSEVGAFVVGVPGTVAGLEEAHRRFGTLPWHRLVAPARALAEAGFPVDAVLARGLAENAKDFRRFKASAQLFLHADGTPLVEGEAFRPRDLANTLRWIEEGGARAFYEGPIAALLVAEMERAGAPMTARDLASYRPVVREGLRATYRGRELLLMPPPSSGGVAVAEILGLLEPMELRRFGGLTAEARHRFAEAQRRAFADRARWLGDPDEAPVPVAELLDPARLDRLRATIDPDRATASDTLGPPLFEEEDGATTHFSVIDAAGNAVANTYTLEDSYGGRMVAEGTGFLLNNELHDFNLAPGRTDRKGKVGTAPNTVRPGRRPLSSMAPCIVLEAGQPVLVTGSPGGRTIISTVATLLLGVLEFGWEVEVAVAAARQHHGWFPDVLTLEEGVNAETRAALEGLGHAVEVKSLGDAHSLVRDPRTGVIRAAADRRIDGWAAAPAAAAGDGR